MMWVGVCWLVFRLVQLWTRSVSLACLSTVVDGHQCQLLVLLVGCWLVLVLVGVGCWLILVVG